MNGFIHFFGPGGSPTLLLLHGTGGTERDLVSAGKAIAPGATILSPRGRGLENGMARYFRRLAEGVFDMEDLRARTDELADWIAASVEARGIDQQPIVAIGFSNGANMVGSLLLRHPALLSGAILLRPMTPFEPEPLPDLGGVPVLIVAGRNDPLVTPEQSEHLAALLARCGANVEISWQPGGHGLTGSDLVASREWFSGRDW